VIAFKNNKMSIKALQKYPAIFPEDALSHAKIVPHAEMALTLRDGIRNMGWVIHKEEFSLTKNNTIVSGVFYVEIPRRLSIPRSMYCLGFTHGFSRRLRLTIYMGLWSTALSCGVVMDCVKGRRMSINLDLHKEAIRILDIYKERTKRIKVENNLLYEAPPIETANVIPTLWRVAAEGAVNWSRMPIVIKELGKDPVTPYSLYMACSKAIQKSPDWYQLRELHLAFKIIKKHAH